MFTFVFLSCSQVNENVPGTGTDSVDRRACGTVLSVAEEHIAEEWPGWNIQIFKNMPGWEFKIERFLESGYRSRCRVIVYNTICHECMSRSVSYI